jgi:hypothetical protein
LNQPAPVLRDELQWLDHHASPPLAVSSSHHTTPLDCARNRGACYDSNGVS